MMRGGVPTLEMARAQDGLIYKMGLALFGWVMVQRYAFQPLFLLEGARRIREAVSIPVGYVGGVLSLADMQRVREAGLDFIELGRATVRDPDFLGRLQRGEIEGSDCDQCNRISRCISQHIERVG